MHLRRRWVGRLIDARTALLNWLEPAADSWASDRPRLAWQRRRTYARGPAFEAKFGVPEREYRQLVAAMQEEWEEHHTVSSFTVAVGRKPA
jgi:hypothetical protein